MSDASDVRRNTLGYSVVAPPPPAAPLDLWRANTEPGADPSPQLSEQATPVGGLEEDSSSEQWTRTYEPESNSGTLNSHGSGDGCIDDAQDYLVLASSAPKSATDDQAPLLAQLRSLHWSSEGSTRRACNRLLSDIMGGSEEHLRRAHSEKAQGLDPARSRDLARRFQSDPSPMLCHSDPIRSQLLQHVPAKPLRVDTAFAQSLASRIDAALKPDFSSTTNAPAALRETLLPK
jgi:hypothetical protein